MMSKNKKPGVVGAYVRVLLLGWMLIPAVHGAGEINPDRVLVQQVNQRVASKKQRLPPLAYEGFKVLTMQSGDFMLDGEPVDPAWAELFFNLRSDEKILGFNPFRSGRVVYTTHATYWAGKNTWRTFFGMDPEPPMETGFDEFELKEHYEFRTCFYSVMPHSYIPEVVFEEVRDPLGGENRVTELRMPDGQSIILDFNTFKVFTEMMQDILKNYSVYEKRFKEREQGKERSKANEQD